VYCPYKEAAEYFKYDLSLPPETYLLWADDNYGYVRAIGDQPQLDKYQGAGVYYHISYWGRPNSTLWVASTPLTQIYSEMSKAYNAGSKDVFMLNVGDIKPGEIPIEFFMNLGWDIDEYNENTIGNYLAKIAARDFGFNEQQSIEFANILKEHYQITAAKRPETQGKNMGTEYSITNYGDEAQQTINKMIDVCNRSETLMNSLDAGKKTAYYQMVQYMIRASRYSFEKSYYQQKNQLYYTQGRFASVNAYAKASLDAYSKILSDVTYYNTTLSSGKWNGILNPYVSDIPQPAGSLPLSYVSDISASDGVGYVCEGQINGTESVTMNFNSLTDDQRFIDVFNRGKTQANFKITTDEKIKIITSGNTVLTKTTENNKNVYIGKVNVEDRVWAVVDWSKAADGKQTANITVSDDFGNSKTYTASIVKATVNPETEKSTNNGFYETNGEVSIEAEHYSRNVAVGGQEWRVMPGLGRSGDSMKVFPDLSAATNATRIDSNFETTSPYLEYKVYFESTGNFIPTMYRLPTLNEGKTCRTAIQFDNGTISLFKGNTFATDEDTGAWATGVLNNIEKLTLDNEPFNVTTPGWHTIKVYKSDAGIVIDKLVLRKQSQPEKASHLGAPESFNTIISYNKQSLAKAPTFSLSDLTFPASNQKYYFDFSSDASNVSAGYIGIDNKMQKSALKCYEWDSDGFASLNAAIRTAEKTSVRDQGIVYSAAASGIKFKMPKAGKYLVSLAIGDRLSGGISVSNMNVTVNGSEVIKGLNVTSGRTIEKGFIVDVSEDQTLKLNLSGSWVLAAVEITPYKEATANDGNLSFTPDINGNINIEAEAAMENSEYAQSVVGTDSYQSEWVPSSGISGHGMFAGPNVNNGYSDTNMATNKGAKLKYKVNFKNTGVYNVWVLVKSQCADDDSLLISIDSGTPIVLNDFRDTESNFKWLNAGQLSVSTAGIHTLTVCEREDGLVLDKIVLTRSTVNPINTGGVMTRDKETIDTTQLDAKIQQGMALLDGNYPEDDLVELRLAIQNANYAKSKENVTNAEIASALDRLTKAIDKLNPSVKPTRIEISKRSLYIQVGKTANLTAVISPSNATNKEVQWTSANKSVATVDSNGKVTAKASGTTTIYATTSNGLQASCTIYVKGWYQSAGKWYFNDDNGKATNKWIKDSSKWYYVDAKGVMQTNKWIKSSGKYYYVDSKGVMSTNKWIKSSGKYYYVDKNGIMQANKWIKASGKYYYVDSKGVMSTNKWIKSSGKWYYVDKNGIMFSNTSKKIGGKTYKFNKSGACINP
jgi:glucan-binding YG repeat protein